MAYIHKTCALMSLFPFNQGTVPRCSHVSFDFCPSRNWSRDCRANGITSTMPLPLAYGSSYGSAQRSLRRDVGNPGSKLHGAVSSSNGDGERHLWGSMECTSNELHGFIGSGNGNDERCLWGSMGGTNWEASPASCGAPATSAAGGATHTIIVALIQSRCLIANHEP